MQWPKLKSPKDKHYTIENKDIICYSGSSQDVGSYYTDKCDLWGFIREINSGISHLRYQFFPS